MPGTIQVSVIDFVGLPSSLSSSSISINVSMGKRHYETWEKGDFSFPLVNLREKLIVTLYDAEGNKISYTGVEAISVVEKGFWDDYFPLEGGGHVHMKLQFILNEEERNRIRMMRESASKKKQSELLHSTPQRPATASTISNTVASSLSHHHEVAEARTGEVATSSMVSNPVNLCTDPQSGSGIKEEIHDAQKQRNTNGTGTSEMVSSTAPVPQGIEVHRTEVYSRESVKVTKPQSPSVDRSINPKDISTLVGSSDTSEVITSTAPVSLGVNIYSTEASSSGSVKVIKTQSPSVDESMNPKEVSTLVGSSDTNKVITSTAPVPCGIEVLSIEPSSPGSVEVIKSQSPSVDGSMYPKEVSNLVGSSELVISAKNKFVPPKRKEDQAQNLEKQGPLEKTPSSVRKMISAFESSRAQDTRPDYKPTTIKTPLSKVGVEAPSKDPQREVKMEITKPTQAIPAKVTNPFLKEESRKMMTYYKERGELLNPDGALDERKSSQHIEQLKELSTEKIYSKGTNSSSKEEGIAHNKVVKKEETESLDVMRISTVDEATISGQMFDEHLVRQQLTNSFIEGGDSGGTSAIMGSAREIHPKAVKKEETESPDMMRVSTAEEATVLGQILDEHLVRQQPTNLNTDGGNSWGTNQLNSLGCHEDKQYSRRSSGTWIFPEEARPICVTTGCSAEATKYRGRMSFSAAQHVEERSLHGEKTYCKPRESEIENSADVENRRGPVGQAIKVAIMVGFGTLVLFTRQRNNR